MPCAGLDVPTLDRAAAGYAVFRVANIFLAIWNDAFPLPHGVPAGINLMSRILELPEPPPSLGRPAMPSPASGGRRAVRGDIELDGGCHRLDPVLDRIALDTRHRSMPSSPCGVRPARCGGGSGRAGRLDGGACPAAGQRSHRGGATGAIGEIFGGIQAVKLAGAEDRVVGHLRRLNQARQKVMVRDRVLEEGLDASSGTRSTSALAWCCCLRPTASGSRAN